MAGMRDDERLAKTKRIEKILKSEPELPDKIIAKRFGCSIMMVRSVRKRLGIEIADSNQYLKRGETDDAARKLGLVDSREVSRSKWKNEMYNNFHQSKKRREEGEDYTRDDTMRRD